MMLAGFRAGMALAALIAVAAGLQHGRSLQVRLNVAEATARDARLALDTRDAIIARLLTDARERDAQRAQLERTRARIDATLAADQTQLHTLINENDTVRAWALTRLPDALVRLHDSAELTGAGAATDALPERDALHAAGNGTQDQR
ncbi:LysB family phage lysis regulatory protein [Burkholderia sp. Nafp2/4-1b]|uniref:LysB family phage lysis regulatory protein n=1 Tax=Burkholderia sp. Nafp2/4-1b TaxID=2116686 RepID=UPI0013CECA96|nr:LysB family phage lysis regulatory protein [Burkholderia sp. Nafp2/4-1b]